MSDGHGFYINKHKCKLSKNLVGFLSGTEEETWVKASSLLMLYPYILNQSLFVYMNCLHSFLMRSSCDRVRRCGFTPVRLHLTFTFRDYFFIPWSQPFPVDGDCENGDTFIADSCQNQQWLLTLCQLT